MTQLYGRKWQVKIGNVDVSELDLYFDIVKKTGREPNTAEVRIWNLSADNRSAIEGEDSPRLEVRAGYEEPVPLIFLGNARRQYSEREGTDITTIIQASDGGSEIQKARIARSYEPGSPVTSAVRDAVSALGIGEGNLADFEDAYKARNGTDSFPDGFTASGQASRVLNGLVRSAGLRWSVQDGVLQLQRPREPLQTQAVRLSPSTGLVGTPTRGAPQRNKRPTVTAQALIQPEFYPGRRVVLESSIEGTYEITQVKYTGNTRAVDWYATLELRPL